MTPQKFYSNGKLLITGEYLVLDGALALAIPTKYGQSLTVEPLKHNEIKWESFDDNGNLWFETNLDLNYGSQSSNTLNDPIAERLMQILKAVRKQNPLFLKDELSLSIKTEMDFPRNWGLGTSSTLINNIAQWAKVDPYQLLQDTFGGSGYDIACAEHNSPITYQIANNDRIIIEHGFDPSFKDQLYFVFLNKKQNSRDGIANYKSLKGDNRLAISEINAITNDMISCSNLETFQFLMQNHEIILAHIIKQTPVKDLLFKDFKGSIKSLGAWGGDFVMVGSQDNPQAYFEEKGFDTIIPYQNMVL